MSKALMHRGSPLTAVVLLLVTAMIAGGVDFLPVPADGASVADDDRRPDSQPCEESQDESSEDEETASGKHAALVGVAVAIDPPAPHGPGISESDTQLQAKTLDGSSPIRGPPLVA